MEDIQSDNVCLPKSLLHLTEPCCPGDCWGSGELIPCFDLFPCTASALPLELSLCQLMRFLTFILLILLPILLRGGSGCVGLMPAGVKSQHLLKHN